MGKGKLHQLLVVEPDLEGKYRRVCEETKKVFNKPEMFRGHHRKLVSFAETDIEFPEENSSIATTVKERLAYTSDSVVAYIDAMLQKEGTNQGAGADLVVDGTVMGTNLPATFLLGLESRLKFIRGTYETIPTLQVGIDWEPSTTRGDGIWEMKHPEEKLKTEMQYKSQILVPPTEHHRAEVEKWQEQVPVGKFVKNVWCSMVTSHEKAQILGRIDKLIAATKRARMEANGVEVKNLHVGKALMDFING